MDTFLTRIFWLALLGAVGCAFGLPPGVARWGCIGFVAIAGALFLSTNVAVLIRGNGSMVPILGGALLAVAVAAVPSSSIRWWALAALVLDPWLPLTLYALVFVRAPKDPAA